MGVILCTFYVHSILQTSAHVDHVSKHLAAVIPSRAPRSSYMRGIHNLTHNYLPGILPRSLVTYMTLDELRSAERRWRWG